MYAIIDLSEKDIIDLTVFKEDTVVYEKKYPGQNRELLQVATEFLEENNIQKQDIAGIAVIVGEGSFTGTRIAVTMANTFAYVLNIPLITITKDEKTDRNEIIKKLQEKTKGQYVSATYSAEPNIGKKS
ncbi:MAG: hypothetical protein GW939_03015 [Candidatus Magasanikbacteria bacterium]|uniref:Gcp-like domain-containing protein n=1 Tax=Candidatus Magasanikbacteria bacterium CG10_big_fil_rev_8_21_14_0_10_38_6 TaxID=1974647 RepID=A0A2M6P223_9BACT|nr:hypothetical protein [Candidatus Magasanikbacteria bacterium]NCS71708.1 hypothetical protein [Candidatus Magasanikbacteria bacterium]PIR77599.1 MAG: hypothetical protein COU30_01595 [Candidatus Magasanikbacteria bacterium CG10_big_fil_rev_8_21_14_0_10_38_6]